MPFDLNNPPDKIRKLTPRKQRQWIHVYNSCSEGGGNEKKCHMQAWGVVKNTASSDCGCGCHGAGTCQMPEIEIEVETPYGEVEVEIKPRYRDVGMVQADLLDIAKQIMETERPRKAGMFPDADPSFDEIKKMADYLAQTKLSDRDAAFLSYALNSFDIGGKYRQIPEKVYGKLYAKAVETYRKNLFAWFEHGLIKRANRKFAGTTVNLALGAFVLDIPESILNNRVPKIKPVDAMWRFLNLDKLPIASRKIAAVVKDDAIEAGLWHEEKSNAVKLEIDRDKRVWYIPTALYRKWTYDHRGQLGRFYGFSWDKELNRWYTEKLNQKIKEDFLVPGQSATGQMTAPTFAELEAWYIKTWLPKNVNRFDVLFSEVLPPVGAKIQYVFKVQRNGNVNVHIRGGLTKASEAIQELRIRYMNRQGREAWLEVMDKVIELGRGGSPERVMHIIDRANSLEHSNGMFMEHFPGNVRSWYEKFLNAKYAAPSAGAMAKYLGDPDLKEIVTLLDAKSGTQRKVKIEDEDPDYENMKKDGPEDPGTNWRKLKYPYPKGLPKGERDIKKEDERVQRGLGNLRSRGSSVESAIIVLAKEIIAEVEDERNV